MTVGQLRVLIVSTSYLLAFALGWGACHFLEKPKPVTVAWSPAQRLPGGGLKLETRPDPSAKPAQSVPAGAKVAAVGQITVKPKPYVPIGKQGLDAAAHVSGIGNMGCSCEPITVDYTLLTDRQGQPAMQTSAEGGEVVSGWHSPVEALKVAPSHPWAAGATYDVQTRRYGGFVDRDIGPLRAGLEAEVNSIKVRLGWRF